MTPGDPQDIRPPRIGRDLLEESWSAEQEVIDGISAQESGLAAVVNVDSARQLRCAVDCIGRYFSRELGYMTVYEAGDDERHLAFLWADPNFSVNGKTKVIGACCFRWREWEDAPSTYAMQWIWLHPYFRRKGLLEKAWPYFQKRFGRVGVERPYSAAMEAFLEKHRYFDQPPR